MTDENPNSKAPTRRAYPDQNRTGHRTPAETRLDRVKSSSGSRFYEIKQILREQKLHTVCEEASCPNIGECFGKGTDFHDHGRHLHRRCPFCDVGPWPPQPLDADELRHLGETIAAPKLKCVVITSVDRDDLRDGGALAFCRLHPGCRELSPATQIECTGAGFRGRLEVALETSSTACRM